MEAMSKEIDLRAGGYAPFLTGFLLHSRLYTHAFFPSCPPTCGVLPSLSAELTLPSTLFLLQKLFVAMLLMPEVGNGFS